jgi:hypothetical protein
MYLHIGTNVLLPLSDMIAIIGYKGKKDANKINQQFLQQVEKSGDIVDISNENVKSMIVAKNDRVYISPITAYTLKKRSKNFGLPGGKK